MLIDSHCHIPHKKYGKSAAEVIDEAHEAGIEKLIAVGTSIKENRRLLKILENHSNVYGTLAIYPHDDKEKPISELKTYLKETLTQSSKIVAIGETGIDISRWEGGRDLAQQQQLFRMHLDIATKHNLPVVIHNRNGNKPVLDILKEYKSNHPNLTGVFHCFDQDWEFARCILKLGFYISFTAMVTYPKKETLLEVVKNIPLDKLLVETDAPYLPPQSHRGEPNYPKYVKIVAEKVAQVKQIPFEEVAKHTYDNTCRLFSLDRPAA